MNAPPISRFESIVAELRRIGLDMTELPGLAGSGPDLDAFVTHLRSLPPGATWAAVLPDMPEGWRPGSRPNERALGPFDYLHPPRGPAVFASLSTDHAETVGTAALKHLSTLGLPVYGSGVVLDRGSPHLYVVLTLGATEGDMRAVIDALSTQPGILNCFPERGGGSLDDE